MYALLPITVTRGAAKISPVTPSGAGPKVVKSISRGALTRLLGTGFPLASRSKSVMPAPIWIRYFVLNFKPTKGWIVTEVTAMVEGSLARFGNTSLVVMFPLLSSLTPTPERFVKTGLLLEQSSLVHSNKLIFADTCCTGSVNTICGNTSTGTDFEFGLGNNESERISGGCPFKG